MKQKYPLARWSPVKQGNRKMSWGGMDGGREWGRVGRTEDRKQERAERRSGSQVEEMAPVQPNLSVWLPCQIQGGSRTITHFFSKYQETVRQHAHKHSHYAPAHAQTGGTRRTRASSVMHLHVKKKQNKIKNRSCERNTCSLFFGFKVFASVWEPTSVFWTC